jgi:hypothetical protein
MNKGFSLARIAAFILLLAVTAAGMAVFFSGGWRETLAHWGAHLPLLLIVLGLHTANLIFDALLWTWVLRDFHVRLRPVMGFAVYLTAFAGLLLPVQLGRFIRPDTLVRLEKGHFRDTVKAEVVLLYLSAATAGVSVITLFAWRISPLLALPAGLLAFSAMLIAGSRGFRLLSRFRAALPNAYWKRPKTILVALGTQAGWFINGAALYTAVRAAPGDFGWWQALVTAPLTSLAGNGSGLPGGIGAVEAFLGVSLKLMNVPGGHLALAVAAFRLVTFWIWIPAGWAMLMLLARKARRIQHEETGSEHAG